MQRSHSKWASQFCWIVNLAAIALLLASCSDQIVYRDRVAFEAPLAGAGNFLGYSSVTDKRTTCGNCHSGKQAQWRTTAHADAWSTLDASPQKSAACAECHSVSSMGNLEIASEVGYVSTQSPRYHDVQCESCHGPGLTHVMNPDQVGTKPLAPLAVGASLKMGCGECHSGTHQPYAEEWEASRHARVVVSRATNPSCIGCHEAKGVLAAWGVKSTFMEESTPGQHMAITCAVCHDPHDARNPGQLRFPMDVPSLEQNLCMKCHYRRAVPEVASSAGPHSPQGPVLLGEAGWIPPNFAYPPKSLVGSHGSDRNPRLCATCHVNSYEFSDALTGAFEVKTTGHSFNPIPCVDQSGVPTGAATCDIMQQSFRACTSCHLTENAARLALMVSREGIQRLVNEIALLLPQIPASEFSTTDGRISTAEGARFNMQLAQERGSPVHNPFLIEALLLASIRQIELDYGLKSSPAMSLEPQRTPPPQMGARTR